jgi:hypothetical protein
MSVTTNPTTNTVVIQNANQTITVVDNNNNSNTVNVTQPLVNVIEVVSPGYVGPSGSQGSQGPSGSQGDSIFTNVGGGVWATTSSLQITGSLTVKGNLIPGDPYVNNTSSYSLGTPTAAWKDLYVSNGSVYFLNGNTSSSISLSPSGSMVLNNTVITGSLIVTGSTTSTGGFTGSLLGTSSLAINAQTASSVGTLTQNVSITGNLNVLGTASFVYVTESIVQVGAATITLNTDNPATRFGGMTVVDSGSFGTSSTGSMLWDSLNNRWIYSNPSGSSYDGGMLISGPRNTSGIGNEQGTTANALMKGQGGDHITSSGIFEDASGSVTFGNNLMYISSSGRVGIGTSTPTYLLDVNGTSRLNGSAQISNINLGTSNNVQLADLSSVMDLRGYNGFALKTWTAGWNSGATALSIAANGYIGINTSSAQYNLDVSGSGRFTNNLTVTGSINASGSITASTPSSSNIGIIVQNPVDAGSNSYAAQFRDALGRSNIWFKSYSTGVGAYTGEMYINNIINVGYATYINGPSIKAYYNTLLSIQDGFGPTYIGGNVGIGTTTPSASLQISGSSGSALLKVDSNASSSILYVSGSGMIGVGTNAPTKQLSVISTTASGGLYIEQSNVSTAIPFAIKTLANGVTTYVDYGGTWNYGNGINMNGYAIGLNSNVSVQGTSNILKLYGGAGIDLSTISVTNAARVLQNGNFLIGTQTDSGYKLTINSSGSLSGSLYISGSSGSALLKVDSDASSSILYVSGSGNVGIGTNTPAGLLTIKGAFTSSTAAPLVVQNTTPYGAPNYDQYVQIWLNAGGGVMGWMRNNGEFQFGNTFNTSYYRSSTAGNSTTPIYGNSSATGIYFPATNVMGFSTTNVEVLRMFSSQNVSIGTTTDVGYRLAIYPSSSLSGSLYVSGSSSFIGNVGIGTSSPTSQLHISASDSSSAYSFLVQNGAGENIISVQNSRTVNINAINTATGDTQIGTTNGTVIFNQGYNNRFSRNSINFYAGGDASTIQGFTTNPGIAVGYAQSNANPNTGSVFTVKGTAASSGSGVLFVTGSSTTKLLTVASEVSSSILVVSGSGFVGINTSTPAYGLDVNGTTRITGQLTQNGNILIQQGSGVYSQFYNNISNPFQFGIETVYGASNAGFATSITSGNKRTFIDTITFNPTGGNALYTSFTAAPTINQTGGSNGITRGIYVSPTLTSAADFRAIETTSGSVIFQSGSVGIGTTAPAYNLDVNGTGRFVGNITAATIGFANNSRTITFSDANSGLQYQGFGGHRFTSYNGASYIEMITLVGNQANLRVGINSTSPNASAILDVASTSSGFLPPRMTNAQRTAISTPAVGLMVYCTDATEGLYIYKSTGWTFIV